MDLLIHLIVSLVLGAWVAEALLYKAVYIPSLKLLNKNCKEVEQLIVNGAPPISRDAHTCAGTSNYEDKQQHSIFVNNVPPQFVLSEDFEPSKFKITVEDSRGMFHHGFIDFNNVAFEDSHLRDIRLKLTSETTKSLIEAEVRAKILTLSTDEQTLGGKLLHSSLMGVSVAASMSLVFGAYMAFRERCRRKVYLDDVRTPRTFDSDRWILQASDECLINESESE